MFSSGTLISCCPASWIGPLLLIASLLFFIFISLLFFLVAFLNFIYNLNSVFHFCPQAFSFQGLTLPHLCFKIASAFFPGCNALSDLSSTMHSSLACSGLHLGVRGLPCLPGNRLLIMKSGGFVADKVAQSWSPWVRFRLGATLEGELRGLFLEVSLERMGVKFWKEGCWSLRLQRTCVYLTPRSQRG